MLVTMYMSMGGGSLLSKLYGQWGVFMDLRRYGAGRREDFSTTTATKMYFGTGGVSEP